MDFKDMLQDSLPKIKKMFEEHLEKGYIIFDEMDILKGDLDASIRSNIYKEISAQILKPKQSIDSLESVEARLKYLFSKYLASPPQNNPIYGKLARAIHPTIIAFDNSITSMSSKIISNQGEEMFNRSVSIVKTLFDNLDGKVLAKAAQLLHIMKIHDLYKMSKGESKDNQEIRTIYTMLACGVCNINKINIEKPIIQTLSFDSKASMSKYFLEAFNLLNEHGKFRKIKVDDEDFILLTNDLWAALN